MPFMPISVLLTTEKQITDDSFIFYKKCLAVIIAIFFISSHCNAQTESEPEGFSFKQLLMPGKVIDGHAKYETECSNCHEVFSDSFQQDLCLDCHQEVDGDIKGLNGFHGRIETVQKTACVACHTEHIGRDAEIINMDIDSFNHKQTDFVLSGKHLPVQCASCHLQDKKYREAETECFACHQSDDRHRGAFLEQCQDCHSEKGWNETRFDHADTDFPLLGEHKQAQCGSCHISKQYKQVPDNCVSCHSLVDAHSGNNDENCESCHVATDWNDIQFEHNKDTDFKLEGAHENLICQSCHKNFEFEKKLETSCVSCHQYDDIHAGNNGVDCSNCHNNSNWAKHSFKHSRDTDFALQGKHSEANCGSCHRGKIADYPLTSNCIDCHQADDVHQQQQGSECQICHTPAGWQEEVRFNHALTSFPLLGMHSVANCESCHQSKAYRDTKSECSTCHDANAGHSGALGSSCSDCHNPNDWNLWIFDHDTQSDYKLEGKHQGLSCSDCHNIPAKNNEIKQSRECISCHQNDDAHNRRFGRRCERCHVTSSFQIIRLNSL